MEPSGCSPIVLESSGGTLFDVLVDCKVDSVISSVIVIGELLSADEAN